jgi:hypothetical protein
LDRAFLPGQQVWGRGVGSIPSPSEPKRTASATDAHVEAHAAVKVSEMDWNAGQSIRSIWESCDLSASEFADEVAAYYQCPRMTLPELLAVPSLVGRFTRRFLLDAVMFPYDAAGKGCRSGAL